MNTLNTLKATLILAAAALFAGELQAADAPEYVRVRSISYAGSGCPAGSVALNISPDRRAFMLMFDQYVAEVGPGVPFNQRRKNCQINLDLDYPSGWSYAVRAMNHHGYVSLERGIRASQKVSLYFQGSAQTATLSSTLNGPLDQDYQIRDVLGLNSQVWSPCGSQRALNINTQIMVTNSGNSRAHGMITADAGPGDLPSGLGGLEIEWQRCR